MRLGIGMGGRLLRGGVSTRGYGVGVGPISAGGSWQRRRGRRRSSGGGGWLGVLLILAAVGWLSDQCSAPHGTQPTQIAPPLAPFTTTAPRMTPQPCPNGQYACGDPDPMPRSQWSTPTGPPPGRVGDCWGGDDCHGGLTPSPPTTTPPQNPPTLLPQQTVPGVPMVPPGGTLPTTSPPCVPTETVSCGPGFGPGAPAWTTPTPRTWATPTPSFTPAHPGQQIADNRVDIPGFIAAMNRNGFRVSDEAATVDSGERACARRASESEDQVARDMYTSSPGAFANLDRARTALSIIERYLCPTYPTEG